MYVQHRAQGGPGPGPGWDLLAVVIREWCWREMLEGLCLAAESGSAGVCVTVPLSWLAYWDVHHWDGRRVMVGGGQPTVSSQSAPRPLPSLLLLVGCILMGSHVHERLPLASSPSTVTQKHPLAHEDGHSHPLFTSRTCPGRG